MIKKPLILIALLLAGSRMSAQEPGIQVDGVTWATCNVATPGVFAAHPEEVGGLFTFDEAQKACPEGWRIPDHDELERLRTAGNEWTTIDGVAGRSFQGLFIPAAGRRDTGGTMEAVGSGGHLWSDAPLRNGWFGYCLDFDATGAYMNDRECEVGMSVRCVKK